jgi:hypothetical protein
LPWHPGPRRRAGRVGIGIGPAGPTPLPATEAERLLQGTLDAEGLWRRGRRSDQRQRRFGELVAASARPTPPTNPRDAHQTTALDPEDGQGEAHVVFGFAAHWPSWTPTPSSAW